MLLKLLVAVCYLSLAICQRSRTSIHLQLIQDPQDPFCTDEETGLKHKPGESWGDPEKCEDKSCKDPDPNDNLVQLSIGECPMYKILEGCSLKQDLSKPFPNCCPEVDCSEIGVTVNV